MTKHKFISRDPEQTKEDILKVALKEFSSYGLAGARVDRIAKGTKTTKGMIYYHFGDKEGLYKAVLEKVYPSLRNEEEHLGLDALDPVEAMERVIDFTLDFHERNRDFVRLVMIENINNGAYLKTTGVDSTVSRSVLQVIEKIVGRGRALGKFKRDIGPVELHILYTSFAFYRVSNHESVKSVLGVNMLSAESGLLGRRMIKDAVISYLQSAT